MKKKQREYPHGTPIEEILKEEHARDRDTATQLWRHLCRAWRKMDQL